MRERRCVRCTLCAHCRITPACAGTTIPFGFGTPTSEDHPRLCGNDRPRATLRAKPSGSPPLVRERHLLKLEGQRCMRITPACAGTTVCPSDRIASVRDHPRLCGNDPNFVWTQRPSSGSPPLVRERRGIALCDGYSRGITPACAGTTKPPYNPPFFYWDHPRLCGNDSPSLSPPTKPRGSPPLVRERHNFRTEWS